jgi:glutamine synthetase adenylyltransferase
MLGTDGKITKEEFMQRAEQRFAQMDANKDGVIDQSERQQMRQRMRECRQHTGGTHMKGGAAATGGAAQPASQPASDAPKP